MTLNEKTAYVKGLIDGLDLNKDHKETKAIHAIADLLGDLSDSVTQLEDTVDDVSDQISEIDDKIYDMGVKLNDIDYKDDFEADINDNDDDDVYEGDDSFYEVECSSCGTKIFLPEDKLLSESVLCPNCDEKINIDFHKCNCQECNNASCHCESSSEYDNLDEFCDSDYTAEENIIEENIGE